MLKVPRHGVGLRLETFVDVCPIRLAFPTWLLISVSHLRLLCLRLLIGVSATRMSDREFGPDRYSRVSSLPSLWPSVFGGGLTEPRSTYTSWSAHPLYWRFVYMYTSRTSVWVDGGGRGGWVAISIRWRPGVVYNGVIVW